MRKSFKVKDILNIRQFLTEKIASDRLVLCTITGKRGSSYRTTGARKIIALNGGSSGLLSGGCLEASIEKAARERFDELPFTMTFDMLSDDDRLLGYQTGCQGAIDVLFEAVPRNAVIDELIPFDPIHLVIVGCGADADAYVPLAESMGWKISLIDYRRDLVERFGGRALHAPLAKLAGLIPQSAKTAAVLMTHNYESDLEILNAMKNHRLGYLGCLGPAQRFEKLKLDLRKLHAAEVGAHLLGVTHAPAGILTHGRSPEEIALSVAAQIQQELAETPQRRDWTLILAAGAATRFGSAKALAEINGETFLHRVSEAARGFSGGRVMTVTGARREEIEPLVTTRHVFNAGYAQGVGSSLQRGLEAILDLDPQADGVVILPVDQPFVTAGHLQNLSRLGNQSGRCALTSSGAVAGPPAYVPKSCFHWIHRLSGDQGLKSVLPLNQIICVEDARALIDVDSVEQLDEIIFGSFQANAESPHTAKST